MTIIFILLQPKIVGLTVKKIFFFQVCLSRLKETVAPSECDRTPENIRIYNDYYPFATVLRLRVLQVSNQYFILFFGRSVPHSPYRTSRYC